MKNLGKIQDHIPQISFLFYSIHFLQFYPSWFNISKIEKNYRTKTGSGILRVSKEYLDSVHLVSYEICIISIKCCLFLQAVKVKSSRSSGDYDNENVSPVCTQPEFIIKGK